MLGIKPSRVRSKCSTSVLCSTPKKVEILCRRNHELDRNLNRLEAKVTMLEQEKVRLADDLSRQNETLKELIDQKKGLETELQEKKNLVTNCGFQNHSSLPCFYAKSHFIG